MTGTPATTASETTFAPPSMLELITIAWQRAKVRRTCQGGTSPRQS